MEAVGRSSGRTAAAIPPRPEVQTCGHLLRGVLQRGQGAGRAREGGISIALHRCLQHLVFLCHPHTATKPFSLLNELCLREAEQTSDVVFLIQTV